MESAQDLLRQLVKENDIAVYKAYFALEVAATRASQPDQEQTRAALAADLAKGLDDLATTKMDQRKQELEPNVAKAAGKVARLLGFVAGAKEVPTLVKALKVNQIREMARWSLDRNPSVEATHALIDAFNDEVGTEFLVGVVNALGKRQGADVLPTLQKATADPACEISMAAIEALANFADISSDAIIAKETADRKCSQCKARLGKARVRLAETLRKAGKTAEAKKVYQAIQAGDANPAQKKAADIGLKAMA